MAIIRVQLKGEDEEAWGFEVIVEEDANSITHRVRLNKEDFKRMSARGGYGSPEELVRKSFEFLLEREPKESILREFNLMDISRYFPEYEEEISSLAKPQSSQE